QQELEVQTSLGPALIATRGYAAPDVKQAYARARELCQQVGETPRRFQVLRGLWAFYVVQADYKTTQELAEQCLSLAQCNQDPTLLLEAHLTVGATLVQLGELTSGLEHLEQGIALYDPQQHRALAFLYGEDPGMVCRSWAAWALWCLGYPHQALER